MSWTKRSINWHLQLPINIIDLYKSDKSPIQINRPKSYNFIHSTSKLMIKNFVKSASAKDRRKKYPQISEVRK